MQRNTFISRLSKGRKNVTDVFALYQYADNRGIDVDWVPMRRASSLSVPLPGGSAAIALDLWKIQSSADHTVKLAHELGHCETGSFYNQWAAIDIRQKHENCADKWAIKKLVPKDELDQAVANGNKEIWELAEYFDVTEDFMRKAICWYQNGNLAVDTYYQLGE